MDVMRYIHIPLIPHPGWYGWVEAQMREETGIERRIKCSERIRIEETAELEARRREELRQLSTWQVQDSSGTTEEGTRVS